MDKSTSLLVELALDTNYASLRPEVVHECKRHLIDTLGCAMGAFDDPLCVEMRDFAAQYGTPAQATLWGTATRCTSEMAAFANGVMLRFQDFNDTFFGATDGGHPSDITAAILAAAETVRADGRSVLAALAAGYEAYCRVVQSVPVADRNFDQVVNANIAAAIAVGKLLKLSREQLGHAISLAVAPNFALRQTRQGQLSQWKGCAAAKASRDALFATALAARGVTGPSDVFEGTQGFWSVTGKHDWVAPSEWRNATMIGSTYIKGFAVCYHAQAGAEAAIELFGRLKGREIQSVDVETYADAHRIIGGDPTRWAPKSRETADHSMPFTVATCLVHGDLTADSFDESRLDEPAVATLMARISVREDPALTALYPGAAPTRVTVKTTSGENLTKEVIYPKGHPKAPMTDREVEAKFRKLAGNRDGSDDCSELLETLWQIDSASDVGGALMPKLAANRARRILAVAS